uniref:Meiosis 1 associated protein n=1 Tax=Podarcis muralis TaxID=64176 RepID=A0A670JNM6_PODMU
PGVGVGTGRRPGTGAASLSWQPPHILVVEAHPSHWAHTCHKLCDALENVFSLACSLAGPPRIPLLSLYVVQSQQECLLPFVPVRGSFSRLQSCLAELRALPSEGVFHLTEDAIVQAVQDGLQQFKQYTGQGMAGASLSSSSLEVRGGQTGEARGSPVPPPPSASLFLSTSISPITFQPGWGSSTAGG